MIIVKLFVSLISINVFYLCSANYCEICTNHTLCKYNTPGPGLECQSYDNTALLSSHDITQLVNKINERRNFVAMGYSKLLPQAANMKKVHWSPELAKFAQRWVDQCDPFTRPDREDQCRDLETSIVGQNIASVAGPAPGLNVKSFVETWFIQVLDYTGSVTYYNQSRDNKTNYFTQLIWADTESIGCGKAKFYVDERNMMLERLVCNFAPKGNIHGKSVYVIGYAATQCTNNMTPDDQFKGLCVYEDHENLRKLQTQKPPVSSLLRIINLSNNSVKQEIDPIRSNLKQVINSNISNEQRNPKTRHVFSNNTYSALKRIPPLGKQNFWKSLMNISRNDDDYLYQQERGHSHVYHGHDTPRNKYGPIEEEITNQDFRRYDYTTEAINLSPSKNYRKYYNQYQQCTRKIGPIKNDCTTSDTNCATKYCTRGMTQGCQQTTTCQPTFREIPYTNPIVSHVVPHDLCPCTKQTCPTAPAYYNCNLNCRCLSAPCPTYSNYFTTPCPRIHRMQDDDFTDDTRKSGKFQYDDMANIVVRSGIEKPSEELSPPKEVIWPSNIRINKSFKKIPESKAPSQIQKQVKDIIDHPRFQDQDHDYLYRSFGSSIRNRRQSEDLVNPLWHMGEYNYKKLPQLKSLTYTTLGNRKNKKSRKQMGTVNLLVSTEPITIKLIDSPDKNLDKQPRVTEKYLSFEELMHLRKLSDAYDDYKHRRKGDATSAATEEHNTTAMVTIPHTTATTKTKTQEDSTRSKAGKLRKGTTTTTTAKTVITNATRYQRITICTRKITCTWTAFGAAASDGVMGAGGGQGQGQGLGSGAWQTPRFVDGCTRSSTCTRSYMYRNKNVSSSVDNSEIGDTGGVPDDEDYCERRSLNVRRRNVDDKEVVAVSTTQQADTDTTLTRDFSTERIPNLAIDIQTESVSETQDCNYNEKIPRSKRQEHSQRQILKEPRCSGDVKKDFSYSDLYYLVLNKIIMAHRDKKGYENNNCQCNSHGSAKSENISLLLITIISYQTCVFRFMKYLLNYSINKYIRY